MPFVGLYCVCLLVSFHLHRFFFSLNSGKLGDRRKYRARVKQTLTKGTATRGPSRAPLTSTDDYLTSSKHALIPLKSAALDIDTQIEDYLVEIAENNLGISFWNAGGSLENLRNRNLEYPTYNKSFGKDSPILCNLTWIWGLSHSHFPLGFWS